jgi:hypothetical protein
VKRWAGHRCENDRHNSNRPSGLSDSPGYANFVAVWHSAYEFTIDFCSTQPPQRPDADAPVVVPCRAVSRVTIPVTLIFDVMRALNENMTRFEGVFGAIRRPGQESDDEPGDIIGN